jgi:hypothetical protein
MERKRRSLWGSITTSEKVDQLTDSEALLYVWMITKCDDEGRMQGKPKTVRVKVCPGRKWSVAKVGTMLERLAAAELIYYYEVKNKKYIEIVDWKKRQTFHGFKPEPSKYPGQNGQSTTEVLDENLASNPTSEGKVSKEKVSEAEVPTDLHKVYDTYQEHFQIFMSDNTMRRLRSLLVEIRKVYELKKFEPPQYLPPADFLCRMIHDSVKNNPEQPIPYIRAAALAELEEEDG